jgi:hypothetical protein
MPLTPPSLTRRKFVQRSSLATAAFAAPQVLPSHLFGQSAPSNKITLGLIGAGGLHHELLHGRSEAAIVAMLEPGAEFPGIRSLGGTVEVGCSADGAFWAQGLDGLW